MNSATQTIKQYLQTIETSLKAGNATEHTHRPALKILIETLTGIEVQAVNEPKRIKCGAPDLVIARGVVPLGYIEAKNVGANLNEDERSEQLGRYLDSLGNLVLTDYLEFRWYLDGERRLTASLPQPGRDGRIRWNANAASEVAQLLGQFLSADMPLAATPKELATRMAGLARLIRDLIRKTFSAEGEHGELHNQLEAFRKVLIESLTAEQFADMYAQTLCYGLFAARCAAPAAGFTRQAAAGALPRTNPFLRRLFHTVAGPDLDERIAWAVDQLAELLARADMTAILADFGRRTRQEDPVVHFYETFLAAYDSKLRETRGVYYTPEPVVSYIVRSVDALLKRDFKLKDGLADATKTRWKQLKVEEATSAKKKARITEVSSWVHKVQILDPATGTGTFLYAVIEQIRERFMGNAGAWPSYVAEHLLPRLYGFELLIAPYAVAHMKLGLQLQESGYDFASNQRLGVFLTNSLDEAHEMTKMPGFTQWLAEEANAASEAKKDTPVMVVLGNPPYSGHSANKSAWIAGLLRGHDSLTKKDTENYFMVDGKPLGERNPKWLNDDYVKFIRFAQWRIAQTGYGILAFVTNHGYLDNPTFRGMRESLLRGFDEIYILDLHGNSKKKEKAPDGGKDENIFDIQQGVAIGIFVRRQNGKREDGALAEVFHADLYGKRVGKYAWLTERDIHETKWRELEPASPAYLFVPEDAVLREEYERGWRITEAMPVNSVGIVTARDSLTIHFTREDCWKTVIDFADLPEEKAREKYQLGKDAQDWKVSLAQNDLKQSGPDKENLAPILYRPFDLRHTYYTGAARGFHCRPRGEVMREMLWVNLAFSITRSLETERGFEHAFVTNHLTTHHTTSIKEVNYHIPLWLYPREKTDLLDSAPQEKTPNFSPEFIAALKRTSGHVPAPDVLAYIYAILYAPSYRNRYAGFLKRDFPRVPLTSDQALFKRLVELGRELIALHTMDDTRPHITQYPVAGSNLVVKLRYAPSPSTPLSPGPHPNPLPPGEGVESGGSKDEEGGRVYINAEQYFEGVPQAVWDYHIGGYRVAEKWLKDRKGRQLGYDDLTHYQNVIAALARTIEIQTGIDAAIEAAGGWPLE